MTIGKEKWTAWGRWHRRPGAVIKEAESGGCLPQPLPYAFHPPSGWLFGSILHFTLPALSPCTFRSPAPLLSPLLSLLLCRTG